MRLQCYCKGLATQSNATKCTAMRTCKSTQSNAMVTQNSTKRCNAKCTYARQRSTMQNHATEAKQCAAM
eukprot:5882975-Pyramimonas_sp.AAC.2